MEKRNRPPASCEPCRHRKLKCNRDLPCDTCIKRNVNCIYATNARRGPRLPSKESKLRDQIGKLESIVSSLLSQQKDASLVSKSTASEGTSSSTPASHPFSPSQSTAGASGSSVLTESPRVIEGGNGHVSYVDASHWQAVLEELKEVRENLVGSNFTSPSDLSSSSAHIPMLGGGMHADIDDILADLPPRPVCNGLLSIYFNTPYSHLAIVHPDKFRAGYDEFWASPEQPTDLIWLSLLFAILAVVMTIRQLSQGTDHTLPSASTLQQRTIQCLVLGNYTRATSSVIEAMLLHLHSCFLTEKQGYLQLWLIMGHTIQLAFRLAYHRDPSRLQNCSILDAEMRRRVWLNLKQVEALGSFQIGLPSMIQNSYCDTGLPGNFDSADLSTDMISLPPPRPLTQRTQLLYAIGKDPVMTVFKKMTQHVQTLDAVSYDRTVALDLEMREVYSKVPALLQARNVDESYMDTSALIWERATIEILYLKGLVVLHRFYLRHDLRNPRFDHSRTACTEAALAILSRQADLHQACLPAGRLYDDRWMLNALTTYDFILAAMVVSLVLSTQTEARSTGSSLREKEKKELDALKLARDIWMAGNSNSEEVNLAAKTLDQVIKSAESRQSNGSESALPANPPEYTERVNVATNSFTKSEQLYGIIEPANMYDSDPMWDMIEGTETLDWPFLDQYFQGNTNNMPGHVEEGGGYFIRAFHTGA